MNYKFAPAFICDFFTPFYDLVIAQGGLRGPLQEKIIQFLDIQDKESVLDVGCGPGGLLIKIKTQYPHSKVVGVDPDPKILDIAKKKVAKSNVDIQLQNAWAEKLPFKENSFDVVVSSLTFHHLPTEIKKEALNEVYRVLKKDGRFLLSDIGQPETWFWKLKFALDPERLLSTGEYMKDNLEGRIPSLLKEAQFSIKELTPQHRGIQFWLAKKS